MRMLEEEAQHLAAGVGPLRIGVGADGAAACPGMAGAMDHPLLEHGTAVGVGMQRCGGRIGRRAPGPAGGAVACSSPVPARAWAMTGRHCAD